MISIEFIGGLPSQISLNAEEAPRAPTKCQLDGYIDYRYLPDDLFTVCLSLSALFGKAQLANNNESETGLLRLMRMCPNDPAVAGLIQTRPSPQEVVRCIAEASDATKIDDDKDQKQSMFSMFRRSKFPGRRQSVSSAGTEEEKVGVKGSADAD
ncbi:hypothetical protein CPB85DRAFT_1278493 [Mucidula mucida]|nr:hypothetical protein CPB85DRAFT_1278493 [Mucidula mucida]